MDEFKEIQIQGEKPRTVWVAIISVGRSPLYEFKLEIEAIENGAVAIKSLEDV